PDGSDLLAGTPDAEVSAAMHLTHEVEHAVVVALLAVGNGGVPEGFDEGFFGRAGGCGEAAYGGGREHAVGVALREGFAFESVAVYEGVDALRGEEFLDAIAEDGFAWIFVPPGVVDRPVADGAPGVVAEGAGIAVAVEDGGHIEVGTLRRETGGRARDGEEELAVDVGGVGTEFAVFLRSPARR